MYSKYAFAIPLENKKGISATNGFNKIIKQSNRKPNKIWVDQGGEFYNNILKKWLSDNDIIMYSTYNEGKSVVAERFIRTLKSKLFKHMTAIGKNVYYDVLDDVVKKYNNTKHSIIKMKPKDVGNNNKRVYIDEHNKKDSRFKVGDRVRISKFKNMFAKGYTPNWSSEIFIVDKVNDTVPYTYNLKDLNDEEILGSFYDRELQKNYIIKMSYYPPYKSSTNNIKVELDLSNYATKDDVKNITHVDVSSYATKTNLSALKTEVDKIDVDKLKTVPDDLAKLSNVVKNEVVKKTDFSADNYVTRTKFSTDTNSLDDKIDKVEKEIPDISSLETKRNATTLVNNLNNRIDNLKINDYAKKTSLSGYILASTFNTKSTELENKIKDAVTKANTVKSDLNDYVKKTGVANDITTIKNDYVSNASLTSRLNDLKSQHIANEVKTIDDKTKKNASDILGFESRLKQKEDIVDEVQRENALTSGRDYYLDRMYLLYECKAFSFKYTNNKINLWKSNGINNYTSDSDMDAVSKGTTDLPSLVDNGRMSVKLAGAYFKHTKLIHPNNNNVINIYIVYKIEPVFRLSDYTDQDALFGGVKITKNATDTSKHKYEGYGICFDEGGTFSKGGINNGRNVLIFGAHENSLVHANNKANNIYVMGDLFVQGINDSTLYAEKIYSQNFTAVNKKFVLSLHYKGDDSYLFVNGKQELKFKAKDDQIGIMFGKY